MTEYLTNYMKRVQERLEKCTDSEELDSILAEHMDKIAFMQHERIVHFLVTMLFALILTVFIAVLVFTANVPRSHTRYHDTGAADVLHQALLLSRKYRAENVPRIR